jgi:NADPH-dependent 2,4-dienoyl-CoA reductase/sulfur reductase-like enzyme/nitrite reductase/ring-hydroxylating ferredoxin subunit
MTSGNGKLKGPDLKVDGVASAEIRRGECLLGHADGDPVLLTRIEGGIVAVSATCTHYGGPLAEGVIADDHIHCPWHHACFDLRTGEATQAPALNPIACWAVEEENGRVRVTTRIGPRPASRRPARTPGSVAVIGGGAAGNSAVQALRDEGYEGPVTLFDPDADAPYDRPNLSKDYLAGNAPEEWIPLRAPDYFEQHGIEAIRAEVTSLDTSRTLRWSDTATRGFGAIIIATGAEPVRLPIAGADETRFFVLRSLADSRAIIAAAKDSRSAVVIGASFIGLEVAASLLARGLEVHVVAPESLPLAKIMGEDLGRFIRDLHEKKGVRFHLGRTVKRIARDHVVLDDDSRIDAGMVVAGVGVRPRVALAERAGLKVEGGIVVDSQLRTSAAGIWAAGDVASWPDPRLGRQVRVEHWVVAQRMGQHAARNVLGADAPFRAAPFFWSQHYEATIAYVGHAPEWDVAKLDGNPADLDCSVTYRRGEQRLAVASIFRDELSLRTELEMESEGRPA